MVDDADAVVMEDESASFGIFLDLTGEGLNELDCPGATTLKVGEDGCCGGIKCVGLEPGLGGWEGADGTGAAEGGGLVTWSFWGQGTWIGRGRGRLWRWGWSGIKGRGW